METEIVKHTCKLLYQKKLNIGRMILLFCKFLLNKGMSQKWAHLTLKLSWLEISDDQESIHIGTVKLRKCYT